MARTQMSTSELIGVRAFGGKNGTKRIGKVRACVFHPKDARCVGFIVKRPDFLLMFRRKDVFVSIHGYDIVDGRIVVHDEASAVNRGACKDLGIDYDECVLWVGLPVLTKSGENLGLVGSVVFNPQTGKVNYLETTNGATSNALLGKRQIPAEYIKGFRRGVGTELSIRAQGGEENELGAILVADEAADLSVEGGLAAKAGRATAVVSKKAKDAVQTAKEKATEKVKPHTDELVQAAGKAINKGAYMTGKQLAKTKGMFTAFKDEFNKARKDD